MEPPPRIEQVKEKSSKCGEKLKRKQRFQGVQNTRMTLVYMEDLEYGYSWTGYVTREDQTVEYCTDLT